VAVVTFSGIHTEFCAQSFTQDTGRNVGILDVAATNTITQLSQLSIRLPHICFYVWCILQLVIFQSKQHNYVTPAGSVHNNADAVHLFVYHNQVHIINLRNSSCSPGVGHFGRFFSQIIRTMNK